MPSVLPDYGAFFRWFRSDVVDDLALMRWLAEEYVEANRRMRLRYGATLDLGSLRMYWKRPGRLDGSQSLGWKAHSVAGWHSLPEFNTVYSRMWQMAHA